MAQKVLKVETKQGFKLLVHEPQSIGESGSENVWKRLDEHHRRQASYEVGGGHQKAM